MTRLDVFLSYSRQDGDAVRQLDEHLRARGLSVWFDLRLPAGSNWLQEMAKGLRESRCVVAVIGGSGQGPWQQVELETALLAAVGAGKPLIPVLVPGAPAEPVMPDFFPRYTWADLRSEAPEAVDRLVRDIRSHLAKRKKTKGGRTKRPEPDFAAYRTWAAGRYGGLSLLGLGGGDVQLPFEDVYVPLCMSERSTALDLEARAAGKRKSEAALEAASWDLELEEVFTRQRAGGGPHAAIFGDPGAGKTTALLKLHHQCLKDPAVLGLPPETLPLFLRLRGLAAEDLEEPLESLVDRRLAVLAGDALPAGMGATLFRRGQLLLLLDGLDEVPAEALRGGLCGYLAEHLPAAEPRGVRAVVSCRYSGYGGKVVLGERFFSLDVRPLGPKQCRRLVEGWFREVPRALPKYPPSEAHAAARRLVAALDGPDYRSQRLKVLVGSPLLLTLLCLVVLQGREMPRYRVAFYKECLEVLLGRWSRARAGRPEEEREPPLDVETALAVLRAVAWEVHTRTTRGDLPLPKLLLLLKRRLKELGRQVQATPVLEWLHREAGVVEEFAPRHYGFAHLGLEEYLVALHVASRGEELLGELAGRFGEEGWREVPLLLAGLASRPLFGRFFERLLMFRAPFEQANLLNACREEAQEVELAPFLALLRPEGQPARQAALLRLLRGRRDLCLREPVEFLASCADPDVAALAGQLAEELREEAAAPAFWDLFLLHHPADPAAARELAEHLRRSSGGLRVRSAAEEADWLESLESLPEGTRGIAALVGPSGAAPWEDPSLDGCLELFAESGRAVVPVLLPGSGERPALPAGVAFTPWVDFSKGLGLDAAAALERVMAPAREAAVAAREKEGPVEGLPWAEPVTGIRFLWIPGGRFRMGGTKYPAEQLVHPVRILPFRLGETPVTNRQYAVFLEQTGHAEPPRWRDRKFSAPEQPVVAVSWDDAMAYCRWLTEVTEQPVTLPSEAQWEFAARGTDGREYPWGNEAPDETRACFGLGAEGQPAPVGSFPAGRGPFGTLDQAGNVWEWCLDAWDEAAYEKRAKGAEAVDPVVEGDEGSVRVLRGGGWFYPAVSLRAAYRDRFPAWRRFDVFGFRVAVAPASR